MSDAMTELMRALGLPEPEPKFYGDAPDLDRVQSVLDLFREHQQQLDDAENAEVGMLTPRITLREHADMHILSDSMDYFMTEQSDKWTTAVALFAIGNESNTLEDLRIAGRVISDAAVLRRTIGRIHTAWGVENAPAEEHAEEFPDSYENDRAKWGDDDGDQPAESLPDEL